MTDSWPWIALAGLGAFHGLNPAMGWLFAVALGLNRKSRGVVLVSMVPIAAGHALSVAAVAALLVATGLVIAPATVRAAAGALLIAWALYHALRGHRHRVRVGMTTGLVGLAAWSFLMATAHGAGLMLWPALMSLCFPGGAPGAGMAGVWATALAGVAVHTAAMFAVTAGIAVVVYEWAGLAFLRHAWLNVDVVWTLALLVTGTLLLIA